MHFMGGGMDRRDYHFRLDMRIFPPAAWKSFDEALKVYSSHHFCWHVIGALMGASLDCVQKEPPSKNQQTPIKYGTDNQSFLEDTELANSASGQAKP